MQGKMKGPPTAPPVETQFAQKLAANDKKDRDKAVKKLKKWLGSRSSAFPVEDMMRIWKGLFYCFWMSDKPLVQEELAENISSMVASFQTRENSLTFVTCFARTFQREWFGIDRWRMDKTMMFVRRFLRHSFRLAAAADWEAELVEELAAIWGREVVLSTEGDSSMGFQLHFTDVFLEELAKVGGEELEAAVVERFVQPWVELVAHSTDKRLREHAEERIFNHLLRQSDPGIQYQMEEDGMGEEEDDEEDKEDNDEEKEGEEDEETENGGAVTNGLNAEDPRAGRVDVFIPQVSVQYSKLADDLFKIGSGDTVRKSNRDALYRISKKFKDVAENIFPLGPNLEDVDQDIPKISVKKAAADLNKRNEKLQKKNMESKVKAKLQEKQKKRKAAAMDPENNDKDGSEDEEGDEEEDEETSSAKRKSESEDEEEPAEKRPKRENQKKKKQERKKMKREAALKASQDKAVKDEKMQLQLDHALEVNSALTKKEVPANGTSGEKKAGIKKKRKENIAPTNGHGSPAKKAKIDTAVTALEVVKGELSNGREAMKKKPKKKVDSAAVVKETIEESAPAVVSNGVELSKKKKLKKVATTGSLDKLERIETDPATNGQVEKKESVDADSIQSTEQDKSKKKLKKKKKELHRIDSDICFSAPSLSQSNLAIPAISNLKLKPSMAAIVEVATPEVTVSEKKKKKKLAVLTEGDVSTEKVVSEKKKKKVSTIADEVLTTEAASTEVIVSEKKKKKKLKKYNAEASLLAAPQSEASLTGAKLDFGPPSGKVFEESEWDLPMQPGEQEIFLPNKKYKRIKDPKPEEATSLPGFESPTITPVKSFTATFLKKAGSKTATPKAKKSKLGAEGEKCASEPRKKKINFALTQNKSQEFVEHLKSVKSSPQIPHDPKRNPAKPLIKKSPGPSTDKLNPLWQNTQLNSRSKTAKLLKKRAQAMDFF